MSSERDVIRSRVGVWLAAIGLAACSGSAPTTPAPAPSIAPAPTGIPTGAPTMGMTAEPSPTPFVSTLTQLTEAGCCVQPFWSTDGRMVLFIDRPDPNGPTGIYGVSVEGGTPQLVSERVGLPSPDGRYLAYLDDTGETIVEEAGTGTQSAIHNGGLRPFFSPHSLRLAWAYTIPVGNFDQQRTIVSISGIDGGNPQEVATIYGGGIAGWLDDDHLLLAGKDASFDTEVALFSLSVVDQTRVDLLREQRIRSVSIAPGGEWILYAITLDPDSAESNGLWIVNRDGSHRYKLEIVGSAHWRDATHLLVIPLEPGAPSHRLWQFDAPSGQAIPLTDPAVLPFRVAAGDWSVSPTGEYVVFLNAEDHALWLISLPPLETSQ